MNNENEKFDNDFANWLAKAEKKSLANIDVSPGADDEDFTPAIQVNGRWQRAKWDDKNPGNHICHSCRGTGLWSPPVYATRGRTGKCHKCQGRGHFKTSGAERAKAREYRRLTTAQKLKSGVDEFVAEHKAMVDFLESVTSWNDFAKDLLHGQYGLYARGTLSEKQIAAAERMKAKIDAKAEAKAKELEWQPVDGDDHIDLSDVPAGRYAVPNGETRLKVLISRPGKNSSWYGYTFVSDAAEYGHRQNYGRQAPGQNYKGKIIKELLTIKADPKAAAIAYGKLTGHCCICNRKLEDENSVAAGIGPICANKF